jgi:hypothetical protein
VNGGMGSLLIGVIRCKDKLRSDMLVGLDLCLGRDGRVGDKMFVWWKESSEKTRCYRNSPRMVSRADWD